MTNEILCVGDIHLGREPGRVPSAVLEDRGLRRADLSAARAWRDTVREALARGVAAVLLAGDVVDSDDGYLSAYAPLAQGVRELIDAGIAVLAVAGNHDTEVLPRLASEIDGLRLLGAKGRWDSELVLANGAPIARVVGWSFPARQVHQDPTETMPADYAAGRFDDGASVPTIGLIHGDLDATGGHYAPLSRTRLESAGFAAWLLGHVHKPGDLSGARPLGYLGCLSGNDPGEAGPRGPWVARVDGASVSLEPLPLAPMRWEEVAVCLDDAASVGEVEHALVQAIRELDARRIESGCAARVVGVRAVLTGRTSVPAAVRADVARAAREQRYPGLQGATYFFDRKLRDEARPRVDLDALREGTDPPAVVAQLLADLESDAPSCRALIDRARRRMQDEADHANFTGIPAAVVTRDDARDALLRSARAALEELLLQRRDAEHGAPAEEVTA